jgi:Fe-coproporphyrin III synthase
MNSAALPPRLRAYGHVVQARLRRSSSTALPHATHLLITWRCNLKCNGCDAWQREPENELSAAEWTQVFRQLPFLDIVKIIGGEPFTRPDLGEIVTSIRREVNPFIVQLVTNGTLTDRIVSLVDELAWPGLHMRISLDGMKETHDRSRGRPGTFDQVVATMRGLSELRKRKKFLIGVNFTMTDESVAELDGLTALCKEMDIDVVPGFKVKPFLRDCDIRRERSQTIGTTNCAAALERMNKARHGASAGFNLAERLCLKIFNETVFRKQAKGGRDVAFRCGELRNLMYINPSGELITCGLNQKPLGNIARAGFQTVWNSQLARDAREEVKTCPGCMQGAVEIMSRLYD